MSNAKEVCNQLGLDRINQPLQGDPIFFYPKEFAPLDNFTSYQIEYDGQLWPTSEHAFQAAKFKDISPDIMEMVKLARSAHDAQKIAKENRDKRLPNWEEKKVEIMKAILRCKLDQHPYVLKKLLETGDREIIEDSWRDDEWGWGENKDGENKLGKIWMELRSEYRNKMKTLV